MMKRASGITLVVATVIATLLADKNLPSQEDTMEELIIEDPIFEGRSIYDTGDAFNTSVAFTIPLFHWNIPTYEDSMNGSLVLENFGILGFATIFALGGAAVAIYTTAQGNSQHHDTRSFQTGYGALDNAANFALNTLEKLGEELDINSCPEYAICSAYAYPEKYGMLGMAVRFVAPWIADNGEPTRLQKAASLGHAQKDPYDDCTLTYPFASLFYVSILTTCFYSLLMVDATNQDFEDDLMVDSIKDLYEDEDVLEEVDEGDADEGKSRQKRNYFFPFDRRASFNTSVAFTIPLFSFTLPGAGASLANNTGFNAQAWGTMVFTTLFLLGGLGVAIYTTALGVDGEVGSERSASPASFIDTLSAIVTDALWELPTALDVRSCARLAICGVHAAPQRFGILGLPLRFLVPSRINDSGTKLNSYQRAATFGYEHEEDDCFTQYPCLMQPLDLLMYLFDYWYDWD